MKVTPLGAGQDVGRSCILVSLGGRNIMFDCGMHMAYNDDRRFPDFSFISKEREFSRAIDCIIISHFHLDHCGALPYFTEVLGYDGPIFMTYPTRAIVPILLEDFRRIAVDRRGDSNFFTAMDIKNCMKKVIPLNLNQTVQVFEDMEIRPYYAGHVLGAAMFHVKVAGHESVLYTGDFNMTPDRHLGAAQADRVRPDLLITETTYATTVRDPKRARERDFLRAVHLAVEKGGKVLIPVFALGRAQELCILLEAYWDRMNLHYPIYFSAGLVERANFYYQLYLGWTNQKVKSTFANRRNLFDFRHIKPFDRSLIDAPGPMVLFATPGMLHAGTSLEVFKRWAGSELNMIIIPGYCVAGTVGNRVLNCKDGRVEVDKRSVIDMKCQVRNLSFSAHADARGILQLLRQSEPRAVMLVHGEKGKMATLKKKIEKDFEVPCFDPPNGTTITLEPKQRVPINISLNLIRRSMANHAATAAGSSSPSTSTVSLFGRAVAPKPSELTPIGTAVLLAKAGAPACLLDPEEAAAELVGADGRAGGARIHKVRRTVIRDVLDPAIADVSSLLLSEVTQRSQLSIFDFAEALKSHLSSSFGASIPELSLARVVLSASSPSTVGIDMAPQPIEIARCKSLTIWIRNWTKVLLSWSAEDRPLGSQLTSAVDDFIAKNSIAPPPISPIRMSF